MEINKYLDRKFLKILGAGFKASIVKLVLSIGQVWLDVNHSVMQVLQNTCSHIGALNINTSIIQRHMKKH